MIKVGLIGAGGMGSTHAVCFEAMQKQGIIKVVGVADVEAEKATRLAEKFGAATYRSGAEMIANAEVDMVDICLPTFLHSQHAIMAMEKGYHVFVEKPVCLNMSEVKAMIAAERKSGVKAMVGQCIRLWPEYTYLKESLDKGTYGKIRNAYFKRVSSRPRWAWDNWFNDKSKSGSAAIDLHIHDADFIRYLLGEPTLVNSMISNVNGNPEHIFAMYGYKDTIVTAEGGWDQHGKFPFEMSYKVNFEKATLTYSSADGILKVYPENGEVSEPEISKSFEADNDEMGGNIAKVAAYYNELSYFVDCIRENKEIKIAPISEAGKSLELVLKEIEAAYQV